MPIVRGFRRFQSNIVPFKQVTEISKLLAGSNVQKSGRFSAASFTSKRPLQKKVSIADRKVMLKSFVKKYRAMNMGKFPSPTSAQKEVGGSYYSIKKMLQEMEYDIKISSKEKEHAKDNKKQAKGEDTIIREMMVELSGSQEVPSNQISIDQQLNEDPQLESVSNFHTNFESKEGLQPSTSSADTGNNDTTRDDTEIIVTKIHDIRDQSHEKPEHTTKDESTSEESFSLVDSETNVEHQYDGTRNIMRDIPERQKDDEFTEKPSLWGNLKSLASGFLNIWKNRKI